jgi:hypothetical protein
MDDILIFSDSLTQHMDHLNQVFQLLEQHQLFVKPEKCQFGVDETTFCGTVISKDGISLDQSKLPELFNSPLPKSVEEIQSFMGMCNWFRGFIPEFSVIAQPLTELTKKNTKFIWTEPHSMRLKVEIEFERGVLDDKVTLRQKTIVEYVIKNKQCHDCIREATDHTWGALLQLRQRVSHKNSLCSLETSMIKAGLHETMLNIQMSKEGIDFFFKSKNQCDKVVEFISTQMPSFKKLSKKL